jgi:uncharacterized protein YjiS (DUF1127 family)
MQGNDAFAPSCIKDRAGSWRRLRRNHWRVWTAAFASIVALWLERARSRRALTALNDHELRDIGITRAEAGIESVKPFWQP